MFGKHKPLKSDKVICRLRGADRQIVDFQRAGSVPVNKLSACLISRQRNFFFRAAKADFSGLSLDRA